MSLLEEVERGNASAAGINLGGFTGNIAKNTTPAAVPGLTKTQPINKRTVLEEVQEKRIRSATVSPRGVSYVDLNTAPFKKDRGQDFANSVNIGAQQIAQSGADVMAWFGSRAKKDIKKDKPLLPNWLEGYTDKAAERIADGISRVGATKKFQGNIENISSLYTDTAKTYANKNFEYKDILTPEFWTIDVAQQVPTLISYTLGGSAIAGLKGLGTLGTVILGGLATRFAETIQNSSGSYRQVLEATGDAEKAHQAGLEVMTDNAKLALNDPLQFAADFIPGGRWYGKLGKLALSSTLEVGEELYSGYAQENALRRAKGEKEMTMGEFVKSNEGKRTIATAGVLGASGNITAGLSRQFGETVGMQPDEDIKEAAIEDAEKNLTPQQLQLFEEGLDIGEQKFEQTVQEIKQEAATPENIAVVDEVLPTKKRLSKELKSYNKEIVGAAIEQRPVVIQEAAKKQGYQAKYFESTESDSAYIEISKPDSPLFTIRISDHKQSDKAKKKFGPSDYTVDQNNLQTWNIPWDKVSAKVNEGQQVSDREGIKFQATKDMRNLEKMTDAEVASFYSMNPDRVTEEFQRRGISTEEQVVLIDNVKEPIPASTPVKMTVLEEAEAAPKKNPQTREVITTKEIEVDQRTIPLPKDLSNAKPTYNYGEKRYTLTFNSDMDRAIYIVGNTKTLSGRDADYMAFLNQLLPGIPDSKIRQLGQTMRDRIKAIAKDGDGGNLEVPESGAEKLAKLTRTVQSKKKQTVIEEFEEGLSQPETDLEGEVIDEGSPFQQEVKKPISPENQALGYQKKDMSIEQKSGYEFNGKNIFYTAGLIGGIAGLSTLPFIGVGVAATIGIASPIVAGAVFVPKLFTTLFFKARVLNAFRDTNTGVPVGQTMRIEDGDNINRISDVMKQFGVDKLVDKVIVQNTQKINEMYEAVMDNLDTILKGNALNQLTGQNITNRDKKAIRNIFPASLRTAIFNKTGIDMTVIDTLKRFMALQNLYTYYPEQVAKLGDSKIFSNMQEVLAVSKKVTEMGGENLVEAGVLQDYEMVKDYERDLILRDTYEYDIKQGDDDVTGGYDTMEDFLAAKRLELKMAQGNEKQQLEDQVKRIKTSIEKKKGSPDIDPYRVHSPIAQLLDYIVNYSETITRQQKMDILEKVNQLDPITIGSKKFLLSYFFNVTMVDEIFFPQKINLPSFTEMRLANKMFGIPYAEEAWKTRIQRANLPIPISENEAKGAAADVLSGALRGAYWMIGSAKQLTQAAYTMGISNSIGLLKYGWRTVWYGQFPKGNALSQFFISNKLSARKENTIVLDQMRREIRERGEYARFGLGSMSRMFGHIGTVLDASSQTLFGAPIEIKTSEMVIANELFFFMRERTKKTYLKDREIDVDALIEDFNALKKSDPEIADAELARWGIIAQTVYDGITSSASGLSFARLPFTKFFNRFVASASVSRLDRLSDIKSLVRDMVESRSFKVFNADKNRYYRQSVYKTLEIAIGAAVIISMIQASLNGDEEDEEVIKKNKVTAQQLFDREFGMSINEGILASTSGFFSTPADYYSKILYHLQDIIQGALNNNKSQMRIGFESIINSQGLIKLLMESPLFNERLMLTSYLNITELRDNDWRPWIKNNVLRSYTTPSEKEEAFNAVLNDDINANLLWSDEGLYYLANQNKYLSDVEFENTTPGFTRLAMAMGLMENDDVKKDIDERLTRVEAFEDARLIHTIFESHEGTFEEATQKAIIAVGGMSNPDDILFSYRFLNKLDDNLSGNLRIQYLLEEKFKTLSFDVTAEDMEDSQALYARIAEEPVIMSQLIDGITNVAKNEDAWNSKDKLKQVFSGTVGMQSPILDAIAYVTKKPILANAFIDTINRSLGDKFALDGSPKEVTQALDKLELVMRVMSKSKLGSEAMLTGVQIAYGGKFENKLMELHKAGLFNASDYPAIGESLVALVGARSDVRPQSKKNTQPIIDMMKTTTPENVAEAQKNTPEEIPEKNMYGEVIKNFGVPFENTQSAWTQGLSLITEKDAPVYAPVGGVVVGADYVAGLGHVVKIQDVFGRTAMFSNLAGHNTKVGSFVAQGAQFARVNSNGMQITLLDEKGMIQSPEKTAGYVDQKITPQRKPVPTLETPPMKDRTSIVNNPTSPDDTGRYISARQDWSLGDTPYNEILKKIMDRIYSDGKIDFTKLKSTIKTGTTKPLPLPKTTRKSILEEFLGQQTILSPRSKR